MLPLIPALAALAVQQGPALIRGIAGAFGGSDTANKVADMVEQVSGIGLTAAQQQASIEEQLGRITDPAALVELQKLKNEMEKEQTRRQELQLADRQSEQHETQETIRSGDNATDTYVRNTRPLMARQSWYVTALYVLAFEGLKVAGYGDGADLGMVAMLSTPAWAYLGLRTLDGFAPHPKSSGQKVQAAVTGAVSNLLTRH
jgi:TolA-binding protein